MLQNIKQQLDLVFTQKEFKKVMRFNLGLLFFLVIIFGLFWANLPPLIPLFYSHSWGEEQLAPKFWFFLLPSLCFLFLIFNLRLASIFVKKEKLLAQILIMTTLILTLLVTVTLIRIFLLVV
jgi:hypothetical protein